MNSSRRQCRRGRNANVRMLPTGTPFAGQHLRMPLSHATSNPCDKMQRRPGLLDLPCPVCRIMQQFPLSCQAVVEAKVWEQTVQGGMNDVPWLRFCYNLQHYVALENWHIQLHWVPLGATRLVSQRRRPSACRRRTCARGTRPRPEETRREVTQLNST